MKKGTDLAKYCNLDVRAHIPTMKVTGTGFCVNSRERTSTLTDVSFFTQRGNTYNVSDRPSAPGILRSVTENVGMGIKDIPGYR